MRIAARMTVNMGARYFWVSVSCMGLSEEEQKLDPAKQREIKDGDVSLFQCLNIWL